MSEEKEFAAMSAGGCSGIATMLAIMGYGGQTGGFWGAVSGLGIGLLAAWLVAEIVTRILLAKE